MSAASPREPPQMELYRLERRITDLEMANNTLRRENAEATRAKDDAVSELTRMFSLFEAEMARLRDDRDTALKQAADTSDRVAALRQQCTALETSNAEFEDRLAQAAQPPAASDDACLQIEITHLRSELALSRQQAAAQDAKIASLETEVAEMSQKTARPDDCSADARLSELMAHTRDLETKLRATENQLSLSRAAEGMNAVLREEKRALKGQIERLQSLESTKDALARRVRDLEAERSNWTNALRHEGELGSPRETIDELAFLRRETPILRKRLERLETSLSAEKAHPHHKMVVKLQGEIEKAEQEKREAAIAKQELEYLCSELKGQVGLLEEQLKIVPHQSPKNAEKLLRIRKDFEVLLKEKDTAHASIVNALKEQLDVLSREKGATSSELAELTRKSQEQISELQAKIKEIGVALDAEKEQVARARSELETARSASLATEERVLAIGDSPFDKVVLPRLELLGKLEAENADLKALLNGKDIHAVPLSTLATLNQTIEHLTDEVTEKTKLEQRTLEAFKTRAYQYYVARLDLLGYDLEIMANRTCLATSVYSGCDSGPGGFEFVYDPVKKCYTDLSYTLAVQPYENHYKYWIKEMQCIPGFLATIFLENFDKFGKAPTRKKRAS